MYLPHEEEEAEEMIHITIARATLGAAVRTAVRYGPTAARAYGSTKKVHTMYSRRDGMSGPVGSFVYLPTYAPQEKWWE